MPLWATSAALASTAVWSPEEIGDVGIVSIKRLKYAISKSRSSSRRYWESPFLQHRASEHGDDGSKNQP